jgi:solute carrier family 35, member F3/4
MYFGVCVTVLITFFWVGTTHCFKFLYLPSTKFHHPRPKLGTHYHTANSVLKTLSFPYTIPTREVDNGTKSTEEKPTDKDPIEFQAPFFASWFCTNFVILFFPIYLLFRGLARKCGANTETIGDILQGFRDRGFTFGRYIQRCITFTALWVVSTYLYMRSLDVLFSTDVIVLFATNVASVYLLSWVILHEQFVGVRVSRLVFQRSLLSCRFPTDCSSHSRRHRNSAPRLHGWDQRLKNSNLSGIGSSFRGWIRRFPSDVQENDG